MDAASPSTELSSNILTRVSREPGGRDEQRDSHPLSRSRHSLSPSPSRSAQWGMDWKCCDTCCQCKCCWDEGEFDPNDRPDFSQQQQDSGPKAQADIGRQGEPSDEDLPAYKPSEGMKVPSTAQYQPATGAIATQSQGS